MKSFYLHYRNKYPDCKITFGDDYLEVYSPDGDLILKLSKNGAGQIVDVSEELGLLERHALDPIVKEARLFKCDSKGCVVKDELFEERKSKAAQAYDDIGGLFRVARSMKDGLKALIKDDEE